MNDLYVVFEDKQACLRVYDIAYGLIRAKTEPIELRSIQLKFGGDPFDSTSAWGLCNYNMFVQMEDSLRIFDFPFVSAEVQSTDFLVAPFEDIKGFFIPVISGNPTASAASFADFYDEAAYDDEQSEEQKEILLTPIFPYRVNALHHFAISGDEEGVEKCFKNKVPFVTDIFGKTPLHYAMGANDQATLNAVVKGLLGIITTHDWSTLHNIMLTIPLD